MVDLVSPCGWSEGEHLELYALIFVPCCRNESVKNVRARRPDSGPMPHGRTVNGAPVHRSRIFVAY